MSLQLLTSSRSLGRIPYLASLTGAGSIRWLGGLARARVPGKDGCVAGWGRKPNTQRARRYAAAHGLPYLTLEDGFFRSVGLGVQGDPPLSIVLDDVGIYYDATRPSRLENLLNGVPVRDLPGDHRQTPRITDPLQDEPLLARAQQCMQLVSGAGLSKYNHAPDLVLPDTDHYRVLVVDQTAGDCSIRFGLADGNRFGEMLAAARREHPDAEILVKIHPDVLAGRKQGHLQHASNDPRIRVLSTDCNPVALLRQVRQVYVVTSLFGFDALLAGLPVSCFGAPFYAGWGLTDDRIALPRRNCTRSIEQLFAATCLLYARYRDPHSGAACELETVLDHLALQRRIFRENDGELIACGFSLWKRGFVRRYLYCPWNRPVRFVRNLRQLRRCQPGPQSRLVVWGARETTALREFAQDRGMPLWRLEDGFLRSVGLGSDLTLPLSLVVDRCGIHFAPSAPSDLENILNYHIFDEAERARAQRLRARILALGLSKYNVGREAGCVPGAAPGQRVILVPGQVETDASIRLGCPDIRTNAALLQAVREQAPDAWIIYKPHPDELSGNRTAVTAATRSGPYDQLVTDTGIVPCLDVADELHTMTSLAGFEALLREKKVVTYGLPFYAGWGLTEDRHCLTRRVKKLELDELVAGCLIRYPRYLGTGDGRFATVEPILERLDEQRSSMDSRVMLPVYQRLAWKLRNLVNGIFYDR